MRRRSLINIIISLFFTAILLAKSISTILAGYHSLNKIPITEWMMDTEQEKKGSAKNEFSAEEELFEKALVPEIQLFIDIAGSDYTNDHSASLPDNFSDTITPPPDLA